MAVPIFTGNTIAVVWDFDQTLIPGYQQKPLFEKYGIDEKEFWAEVKGLEGHYLKEQVRVSPDTLYLNHLLTYVAEGKFPGLNNKTLKEIGSRLEFYPGMPDFLDVCKRCIEDIEAFKKHEIHVEHYVVSTGLRQVILGSPVAAHVRDVWACEFIESPAGSGFLKSAHPATEAKEPVIRQVAYFLDNTTKTRAIWEINKGTNVDPKVGVNDLIAPEDRRVPLRNMLYIADGPNDIPVFSILNQFGGRTMGVYNPAQDEHFRSVKHLRDQGRVQHIAEANYTKGSGAYRWILLSLEEIADLIVKDRQRALADRVRGPGGHVV